MNILKASPGLGAPVDASNNLLVDVNGMPNGTFTGNVGFNPYIDGEITGNSVQWELSWSAGCTFKQTINQAVNLVSSSNATTSGGSNSNLTVTSSSSAGNVIFTFFNFAGGTLSTFYPSGFSNSCAGGSISLVRVSDMPAYNAGAIYIPEYLATVKGLNPRSVRLMGWTKSIGASDEVQWGYRATLASLSWTATRFLPNTWGKGITGTDTYTIGAAPDTPLSGWVAGETIQGVLANAPTIISVSGAANNGSGLCRLTVNSTASLSTNQVVYVNNVSGATGCNSTPPTYSTITVIDSTHADIQGSTFGGAYTGGGNVGIQKLTITGKTGGSKFIGNAGACPMGGCFIGAASAGDNVTMVYDSVLDMVLLFDGGLNSSVPIEAEVAFANSASVNMWANLPPMANDTYVSSWASAACSSLNSGLYFYPEYGNEMWNTADPSTLWNGNRGLAFGFPIASSQNYYSTYGLRVRQVMGNLIPAACSAQMAHVRRTLMFQEFGDKTNTTSFMFNGSNLAPSGTGTGIGNSVYSSFTGSANYTTSPNRPIDNVDVIGYANYTGGVNLCLGPDVGCTPTSANVPYYNALLNAYENISTAAAIALVDSDIRNGQTLAQTVTGSGTTFTTPLAHGFTANSTNVSFSVAGGTSYSGLSSGAMYQVSSTPTSTTFTIKGYVAGSVSGSNINAGTAGSGTVTVGSVSSVDMAYQANLLYPLWESVAAGYDAGRTTPLRVELYEGAFEPVGPTQSQCTSLGIVDANCATNITAALMAWKNDPTSAATTTVYANQFLGTDAGMVPTFGLMAHSKTPAWLQLEGTSFPSNPWSLMPADIFATPYYQTYTGWANVRATP